MAGTTGLEPAGGCGRERQLFDSMSARSLAQATRGSYFPQHLCAEPLSTHYHWYMIHWQDYISSNPQICAGEPCVAGTRIPVTVVLDSFAEGSTRAEILPSYPSLRAEHIDAALSCAAELAYQERLVPIRGK